MENDKCYEIIIADRDIRIYLGQCLVDFQRYDQIVLSAGEAYVEKQRYIANILEAVGIVIDDKYLGPNKKIKLISEESEIVNERTGRREMRLFHKLGLTKIPELFMYTDPDKAVDVPPIDERAERESSKKRR